MLHNNSLLNNLIYSSEYSQINLLFYPVIMFIICIHDVIFHKYNFSDLKSERKKYIFINGMDTEKLQLILITYYSVQPKKDYTHRNVSFYHKDVFVKISARFLYCPFVALPKVAHSIVLTIKKKNKRMTLL